MLSEVGEFPVQFRGGLAVRCMRLLFCSVDSQRVMAVAGNDLSSPTPTAANHRNAFESRGVSSALSFIHTILVIVRWAYFAVVESVSRSVVYFSRRPFAVFVQIYNSVCEVMTFVYLDVTIPVCKNVPGDLAGAAVPPTACASTGNIWFPNQLGVFFVNIEKRTDKFCSKIVSRKGHAGLQFGGAPS